MTLTPVNCAGDTCSIRLGRDPAAVDGPGPSALRGELIHDDTLECDAEGMRIARCDPVLNLDPSQKPNDVDSGNMLRKVEDCGLIVVAPLVISKGQGNLVKIPSADNADSAVSHTINHTNNDSVDQLVTLTTKVSVFAQKTNANGSPCHLLVRVHSIANINEIMGASSTFMDVNLASSNNVGTFLRDGRFFETMWRVAPGVTLTVQYRTETLEFEDVNTEPANQAGFQVRSSIARIEQVRSS